MYNLSEQLVRVIRDIFKNPDGFIGLHEPLFIGNEKKYLIEAIDSTYVSSVGAFVNKFEAEICNFTNAKYAVAMVNGTTALQLALEVIGVNNGDEVITQPLTFVATCNAIAHCGATPIFVDVDKDTLGLSPIQLAEFLASNADLRNDGFSYNKLTSKRIAACVPMHSFGMPCRIDELVHICNQYNIPVIEDAAESLGSYYKGKHTGTFGKLGTLSFNGNKTITSGGGGAIFTDDELLAKNAKHLSTTAKLPHAWEFNHDQVGYNFRMPNINAALACAQLEQLPFFLQQKQWLADEYLAQLKTFDGEVTLVTPIKEAISNNWLNTLIFNDTTQQQAFLKYSNEQKVITRPAWKLMNQLPMYANCQKTNLSNAEWLAERLVNIPSSVITSN